MNPLTFDIKINDINRREQKEILKDKSQNKTYFQKEFNFRKQEKTTTVIEIPSKYKKKPINFDNTNNDLIIKEKPKQKDIHKLIDNFNNKEENEDSKYTYIEPERSISTECSSYFMNNSELLNSNNYDLGISQKSIIIPIDVNCINYRFTQEINEEAEKIKEPNLNNYQKIKKVLEINNTLTEDLRTNRFNLNIEKIEKRHQKEIKENINNLNDNYYNNYEKIEKKLKEDKTTTINLKNRNIEREYDSFYSNEFNGNSISMEETKDNTKAEYSGINSSNQEIEENIKKEKTFNSIKEQFYKKNKLYDYTLYEGKDEKKNILIPEIYKIDKGYGFLYPNDIITNFISKSAFLGEKKDINKLSENDVGNCKFYDNLGQYFCGKEVKLEKEKQIKRCCPNEFMCKSCMDINKKKYNIKNNYLINIKGRVAKINKGSYHCFGKFLCGNQKVLF